MTSTSRRIQALTGNPQVRNTECRDCSVLGLRRLACFSFPTLCPTSALVTYVTREEEEYATNNTTPAAPSRTAPRLQTSGFEMTSPQMNATPQRSMNRNGSVSLRCRCVRSALCLCVSWWQSARTQPAHPSSDRQPYGNAEIAQTCACAGWPAFPVNSLTH